MSVITVKDANGRVDNIDVEKDIKYICHDMSYSGNKEFIDSHTKQLKRKEVVYTNNNNDVIQIADNQTSVDEIDHLIVNIEATHSDTEINAGYYTPTSMLRDFASYMQPYNKPLIKNHDDYEEPIGRIVRADCIDSYILDGKKAVDVDVKVTDKDAIQKFMDGRYNTVSIGAYPGTITCNTCGKKILQNSNIDLCGHMRGRVYNGKKCTWNIEDLTYCELSVVNKPADPYAQVKNIKIVTKADLKKQQNNDDNTTTIKDSKGDLAMEENKKSLSDEILDFSTEENTTTEDTTTVENNDTTPNDEVANNRVKELEELLNNKEEEIKALNEQNCLLEEDNKFLTNKAETLATMYKNDLVAAINRVDNKASVENSFKELKEMFNSLSEKVVENNKVATDGNNEDMEKNSTPQSTVPVSNPGIVDNSAPHSEEEKEINPNKENNTVNNAKHYDFAIDALVK